MRSRTLCVRPCRSRSAPFDYGLRPSAHAKRAPLGLCNEDATLISLRVLTCTGGVVSGAGAASLEPIRKAGVVASLNEEQTPKRTRARTPNNKTTTGFRISEALWEVWQPLLPVHVNKHRFGGGQPRKPDRVCADAIFYVLRTGCQGKALAQTALCPGSTAHDRFQE